MRYASLLSVAFVAIGIFLVLQGQAVWGVVIGILGIGMVVAMAALGIRSEPGSERLLVLVTKRDCSLCDEAKVRLRAVVLQRDFVIQEVLLEDFPELERRYRDKVPVLLWQQEEVAYGRFDWKAVEKRLADVESSHASKVR
jgi:hypothetical protein